MLRQRFSLLLLEPGEIYFEDFAVDILTDTRQRDEEKVNGQLKMCSKSLVFEPTNIKEAPLIKIHFSDCTELSEWPGSLQISETNVLAVTCKQFTELLANGQIAPYKIRHEKRTFLFHLHYVNVGDYLPQLCQLYRASTLNSYDQNSMIATIVYSRHNRVKFNPLWMEDIYEKKLKDCKVDQINPLILNPGRLLLTNLLIYFQPYNNIQPYPVIKIRLDSIRSCVKRRFLLRPCGLEIAWDSDGRKQLLYVAFINEAERNGFYDMAIDQPEFSVQEPEPEAMTLKWQNGALSNFDYLMYLNSLADRTKLDLTQYPVFPWIIADYTSEKLDLADPKVYRDLTKPMGALNADRLEKLIERTDEMGEPKFLYGSHYSAPGLVLFYLVRQCPESMLCFQNGRFDHPDRMFNDMQDVWKNCNQNMADFKELIPEFYDTDLNGDFLVNTQKINFGNRHDGQAVNNVKLPPWAKNSPATFVRMMRDALESDHTSQHLHAWIDLVFGYKQRGEEAIKAHNLFFYLCYEGAVDLDAIDDMAERHALEIQISEFGQIPKQLFSKPHAARFSAATYPEKEAAPRKCSSSDHRKAVETEMAGLRLHDFRMTAQISSHKDEVTSIRLFGDDLVSTGRDGNLKCYNFDAKRQTRMVSIGDGSPLSSVIKIPNTNVLILSSWNNSIITYDLEFGKVTSTTQAHDDAISCLSYFEDTGLLVSGSWDCSVKIWRGFGKQNVRIGNSVIDHQLFDDRVVKLDAILCEDQYRIAVALNSGEILVWRLHKSELITVKSPRCSVDSEESPLSNCQVLTRHKQPAIDVKFNQNGEKLVSCGADCITRIVDIETSMLLFEKETKSIVNCVIWACNDNLLIMGSADGAISVWNMWDGSALCDFQAHRDGVSCLTARLAANPSDICLISGGRDGPNHSLKIWEQC